MLARALAVVVVCSAPWASSWACSIRPQSDEEKFARATAVFVATVESVRESKRMTTISVPAHLVRDLGLNPQIKNEITEIRGNYVLRESLKGQVPTRGLVTLSSSSTCHYMLNLKAGSTYVLAVSKELNVIPFSLSFSVDDPNWNDELAKLRQIAARFKAEVKAEEALRAKLPDAQHKAVAATGSPVHAIESRWLASAKAVDEARWQKQREDSEDAARAIRVRLAVLAVQARTADPTSLRVAEALVAQNGTVFLDYADEAGTKEAVFTSGGDVIIRAKSNGASTGLALEHLPRGGVRYLAADSQR